MTFAPIDAEYLTLAANGVLTDYRILTLGSMLVAVDGGPAGTYTLNVDPTQIDHADLDNLTTGNPHTQYMLGTILSANGDILTRVAGSPAALPVGSDGDILTVSGGLPAWSTPSSGYQLLDSQPAELLINTTNALQTFYTFTIPANTLTAGDLLRLGLLGDYLNNSGSSSTVQIKITFGGTVIYDMTTGSLTASATRRALYIDLRLAIRSQNPNIRLSGNFAMSTNTAPTTGIGNITSTIQLFGNPTNDVNLDLTSNQTLLIQLAHSVNNANTEYRRRGATLEHIAA